MASSTLRIKVRCPSVSPAPFQLDGCTAQTTFAEFLGIVSTALGLASGDDIQPPTILAGFPPRPLDLPQDAAIGSALSVNENVTVRLATQSNGGANPEGGKWGGRSKRAPKPAAPQSPPPTTRTSTRGSKSSNNTAAAATAAAASTSSSSATSAPTGSSKRNAKTAGKKNASGSGANGGGAASNGNAGGVHTLAGPLTPLPARTATPSQGGGSTNRAVGAIGGSRAGAGGSPPGHVTSLFGSGNAGSSSSAARGDSAAGGQATSDGEAAGDGKSGGDGPSRKRSRGGTGVSLSSEGDIADRLLRAVGGGGKGTADRFFRKAMKLAVDKQYDQSRADARVRAALGGWYTAEASAMQRRLGDGESVALNVSFSKGLGAKSQFEETVDRVPREQVAAVVRMIAQDPESREMLKPHNFAGCSPRMFWSLVEYWGGDIPRALRLAAPDVDWGFLETRERKLSEKAVANAVAEEEERRAAEEAKAEREKMKETKRRKRERRKRRREGIESDSSDENPEASSSITAADEIGAENVGHSVAEEASQAELEAAATAAAAAAAAAARQRAANAALARIMASQQRPRPAGASTGIAVAAVPVAASLAEIRPEGTEEKEDEVDMEGLTEVAGEAGARLLVAAGVKTLGKLADRDEEELTRELRALQGAGSPDARGNAAGDGAATPGERVSEEEVSEWVQEARGEELDEIMARIVGGDEDVVEALEEVAVSTPRDLVRLGAFPDVLVGAVRDRVGPERWASLEGRITAMSVEAWRREGDRLLEQRPWLELWVHQG